MTKFNAANDLSISVSQVSHELPIVNISNKVDHVTVEVHYV